ncbi:MAG: AraC family transcriptional regulator [Ruminococcus sp.]|nr:AraC family transcriptional regulator [Ruminococcus sp.]
MSAVVETNIYPYAEKTGNLPVCLRGIGGTEWQGYHKEGSDGCWYKILYCVKGRGCLHYDDQSTEISAGDIFFMPRAYPHEYCPIDRKWTVRWVVFDGKGIKDMLSELGLGAPVVLKGCELKELNRLFDRILLILRADRINGIFRCSGLCYDMILELHGLLMNEVMPGISVKNEILLPVLDNIEDNFRRDLPITELVELSGVSHQYLGRIFRQAMGTSIEKYIMKRRLWEAKHLLLETDSPVSEIAKKCGFRDSGYFSTVFRREENMSPIEYRRISKKTVE